MPPSVLSPRALSLALALGTQSIAAMPEVDLSLEVLGTYESGIFDEGAAEIVAHDPKHQQLFVSNADAGAVDVLDVGDPTAPVKIGSIAAECESGGVNSVAVSGDLVAIAVENEDAQEPGCVEFYDTLAYDAPLGSVGVGALPDMVAFTPDGQYLLVANEGEPNDAYDVDPEGSISVVDLRLGVTGAQVATAGFAGFNGKIDDLREAGVRIFGPGATVAQDLEPEYIAVSKDSKTAWVALQENNAFAVVDVESATVTDILPLGTKDHSLQANALDPSDRDDGININSWPVHGMYQPDSIASLDWRGQTFIVTANEGDARDYDGFSEETRVEDETLDADAFPNAATLQLKENLGRLNITSAQGDTDGDGDFDELYAYGARSFSIWNEDGELIYDSGDDFERLTAERLPDDFNSDNDENGSFDSRSDAKGPEPEAVALGRVRGRTFAFIGLERVGGIMTYEVTDPYAPRFVDYVNNRDFGVDAELNDGTPNPDAGDLGPESIVFVPVGESPARLPLGRGRARIPVPMLAVGNEVSGTTTLYGIRIEHGQGRGR